jgi:ATP-binding cassette subfamily C (CFTR/MRP) protein 1
MHHGSLVEYGAPHSLLETEGSRFRSFYEDGSKNDGVGQAGDDDDDVIRVIE